MSDKVAWTEEDDIWLTNNYHLCKPMEAEKHFNKTWHNIKEHARKIGLRRYLGSKQRDKFGILNTITTKEAGKVLGIAEEEVILWSVVYPECLSMRKVNGVNRIIFDSLIRFLKTHQDLWDSTKMTDKSYLDEYKWFQKKHDEDFKKMIQRRWGKDAK